jgi:hypothetical protein
MKGELGAAGGTESGRRMRRGRGRIPEGGAAGEGLEGRGGGVTEEGRSGGGQPRGREGSRRGGIKVGVGVEAMLPLRCSVTICISPSPLTFSCVRTNKHTNSGRGPETGRDGARAHTRTHRHTQIHARARTHAHTHTRTHANAHTHAYTHKRTHARTDKHGHRRAHTQTNMDTHTHAHTHTIAHARTKTNTDTHSRTRTDRNARADEKAFLRLANPDDRYGHAGLSLSARLWRIHTYAYHSLYTIRRGRRTALAVVAETVLTCSIAT